MKKVLVTALIVSMALGASGQAVDTSMLDLSNVEFSLAGPDAVYVTNILYGGTQISVLLRYNGGSGATIYGPYTNDNKLLLDSFELGRAEVRIRGGDTLVVSDLLLYGTGVTGRLKYDGVYTLNLASWSQTDAPVTAEARVASLEAQIGTAKMRYDQETAATAAKYEGDLASAQSDLAAAERRLSAAQADIRKLNARVSMGTSAAATPSAATGASIAPPSVDPSELDLSGAMLHLAGPDTVYVTDIMYSGIRLSVLLKHDGAAGASIYGPYFDDSKVLLDSFQFGSADLRLQGNDTVIVSDLVLYGQGISGRLTYDGVHTLGLASWWESITPVSDEARIANLERDIASATARHDREMASAVADLAGLRMKLSDAEMAATTTTATTTTTGIPDKPSRTLLSGFTRGSGVHGNWSASGRNLTQSNSSDLLAKYAIPVNQRSNRLLYSFTAQAASSGTAFVGYGLHFMASGDKAANSYGYGNSYLVWVTRDPGYHKNNDTYVQIYRSFDDVNMLQVASVSTGESVTRSNDVEVLYDKPSGVISVSINGTTYASYRAPDAIRAGGKTAFRTLGGPVTFSDYEVKGE